jgi:integrase/recombinase XerD
MDTVREFTDSLKGEGKSPRTTTTYLVAVRKFLEFHDGSISKITQNSIDRFFPKFYPCQATQNLRKNSIRKFLAYLRSSKRISKQFTIRIKNLNRKEPSYLSYEEQKRFLAVLKNDRRYYRDYVLFSFMIFSGLRLSEVLSLRVDDVQTDSIIIRQSKNGSGKIIFKNCLKKLVSDYLKVRKEIEPYGREEFLFLSNRKKRINSRTIQIILKKYLKLAKIQKQLTPHSCRHAFATRLRESGSDIETIRRLLRHRNIQSTLCYSHVADSSLKQSLERMG